ncbi:hypothetical protein CEXT_567421 [Caerostris extrusa]|uniref:Uncharacterized protein n=1 Tax=Caerostris extrusa TaxID=172846 RepID=A0AAV4TDD3_CAEEX|nr:hypothetical protein CEXT_567421 [Caerostris extrusa]
MDDSERVKYFHPKITQIRGHKFQSGKGFSNISQSNKGKPKTLVCLFPDGLIRYKIYIKRNAINYFIGGSNKRKLLPTISRDGEVAINNSDFSREEPKEVTSSIILSGENCVGEGRRTKIYRSIPL